MGMIFVPNDGISHAPQEYTSWDDCANGVEVLYRSICCSTNGCSLTDMITSGIGTKQTNSMSPGVDQ